jgi:hypothetical protein
MAKIYFIFIFLLDLFQYFRLRHLTTLPNHCITIFNIQAQHYTKINPINSEPWQHEVYSAIMKALMFLNSDIYIYVCIY